MAATVPAVAVALSIVLLSLSALCGGHAVGAPFLCVLPIGDSLTQGMDGVGSYRSHLHSTLTQWAAGPNASIAGHRFLGFRNFHCKIRNYNTKQKTRKYLSLKENRNAAIPHGDFKQLHISQCGWTSSQILNAFRYTTATNTSGYGNDIKESDIAQWRSIYPESMRSCREAALHATGRPPIVVALLLFGHNDGFFASIARCHLFQDQAPRNEAQRQCVDDNLQQFRSNIPVMLSALEAEFAVHQSLPLVVLVGLNPPLYFPTLDVLLPQYLRKEVPAWRAAQEAAAKEAGRSPVDVGLVEFKGWQRNYTFDAIHPDHRGCRLMADAWLRELAVHVSGGSAPNTQEITPSDDKAFPHEFTSSFPHAFWLFCGVAGIAALLCRCLFLWQRRYRFLTSEKRWHGNRHGENQ